MRRTARMSEFFDYLNELVWQVESGRLRAQDVRRRMIEDWGGVTVRGYVPKRDPMDRKAMKEFETAGYTQRHARRLVTGK